MTHTTIDPAQASLFDANPGAPTKAHARRSDPATSHDAAHMLTVDGLRPRQAAVLAVLKLSPRAFDDLIKAYDARTRSNPVEWPKQSPSGIRTRVSELVTAGRVKDSGRKVTLPSGRKAIVWEATAQ